MDWETAVLYVFMVIALGIAMGVAVLITTGSILGGVGTVGIFMFAGTAARILPLWMILVFALLAGTWLYTSKSL